MRIADWLAFSWMDQIIRMVRDRAYSMADWKSKRLLSATRSANRPFFKTDAQKTAPNAVPKVFVRRSVMPESRVGRYDCSTSMVRLTAKPRAIVSQVERLS